MGGAGKHKHCACAARNLFSRLLAGQGACLDYTWPDLWQSCKSDRVEDYRRLATPNQYSASISINKENCFFFTIIVAHKPSSVRYECHSERYN